MAYFCFLGNCAHLHIIYMRYVPYSRSALLYACVCVYKGIGPCSFTIAKNRRTRTRERERRRDSEGKEGEE